MHCSFGFMQADLQRALKKPRKERRWAMAIDTKKCIGCRYCLVACPYPVYQG